MANEGGAATRPKPVVLAVLDGWGVAPAWGGNAVTLAHTPFMNMAENTYPYTTLAAAGRAVGLPSEERGNSEVGHLNIGSGQVVQEAFPAITSAIKNGSFYTSPALIHAFTNAKQNNKAVHILGLCSDGGIHSHIDHLYALLEMARQFQVANVYIHAIADGRDTPPFVAEEYLAHINDRLKQLGFGAISTVSGRYYAMDRDHRWDRVEKTYRAITEGVGVVAPSAEAAVALAYRDGYSDEFVAPTVITQNGTAYPPLQDGDSFIFFNFRGDRAREITQALVKPDFDGFKRRVIRQNLVFVGFTYYQEGLPIEVAFNPRDVEEPLAFALSQAGLKQLHVAESEKYAHVTYFFNGGREAAFPGEDRIVIPSPKVGSYDQIPEMSEPKITNTVIENLKKYDFIILNFANPDMVGHTGNLRATMRACEAVDQGLNKIFTAVKKLNGLLIVTADHGNAEQKVNPKTGEPDTEHTANPVPFILVGDIFKGRQLTTGSLFADKIPGGVVYEGIQLRRDGVLSDIAPTILQIMGIQPPSEMTGHSLILSQIP